MDYNCIRVHLQHHLQHKSPHFRISSLVLLFIVIPTLAVDDFTRIDPLKLLSGTLRTYQRAACDNEYLQLSCPRGTTISIEFAQYEKSSNANGELCPDATQNTQNDGSVITSGTEIEIKASEKCKWPTQHSLIQIVVETCQKKRTCKLLSSPKTFGGDPCPGQKKFLEVAYKCRPSEFRSKVACENDVMSFECNPYSRIAVNSASFGRTEYESLQCPQQPGVKEENCLASYATETVMQFCHGRRRCNITADQKTFGKPCQPDSRMYLKAVYTCLPRKILIDRFESTPELDEPLPYEDENEFDHDDIYDEDQLYNVDNPPGPAPKLQGDLSKKPQRIDPTSDVHNVISSSISPPQPARDESPLEERRHIIGNRNRKLARPSSKTTPSKCLNNAINQQLKGGNKLRNGTTSKVSNDNNNNNLMIDDCGEPQGSNKNNKKSSNNNNDIAMNAIGSEVRERNVDFIEEWMNTFAFLSQNQERLYLLLIISATSGVILCLLIITIRWLLISRRSPKEENSEQGKVSGQFKNSNTGETTITNGFSADDISEIDADIDLTTPLPMTAGSTRHDQNFNTYTPSPSPYGNLGPSNLSHTSSTLLMPQSSVGSSTGPPSILSGSINPALILPSSSTAMTTGFVNMPSFSLSGTLPRQHPVVSMSGLSLIPQPPQPSYISGSILGHPTLRRQSSHDMEQSMPRILGRNTSNVQYYYG